MSFNDFDAFQREFLNQGVKTRAMNDKEDLERAMLEVERQKKRREEERQNFAKQLADLQRVADRQKLLMEQEKEEFLRQREELESRNRETV